MYLLLVLLVSPAFGRPSSDVGADISKQLDDIMDFSKETGKLLNNARLFGKVSEDLLEAEQNIRQMEAELRFLQSKIPALKGQGEYLPKFYEAKFYLGKTRQELRELALRTVVNVRRVKTLLKDLDNSKHPVFFKIVMNKMKDLMTETGERLEKALKKYRSANSVFDNLISSIKAQNKIVDIEVTKVYNQYRLDKDYAEAVRRNCKIGDWFTFGLCSLIHDIENEVPLEQARIEYEKLQAKTDKLLERTETLNADIVDAINMIEDEIELINKWAISAERVSKNIDRYPEEHLKKYERIKTNFRNRLDNLKKFAAQFLAQT